MWIIYNSMDNEISVKQSYEEAMDEYKKEKCRFEESYLEDRSDINEAVYIAKVEQYAEFREDIGYEIMEEDEYGEKEYPTGEYYWTLQDKAVKENEK